MNEAVKAVYEKGHFRPLEPLKIQLDEGQIVVLTVIKVEASEGYELRQEEKDRN